MMNVDIDGEEGHPWWWWRWWLGGSNNPSGGSQPDYNPNPGDNSSNTFHNSYTGPGTGNQGGGNSGNYGGNYDGNTTAAGSILFSILQEVIYGNSGNSSKPNPYVGLDFKPTTILSVTSSRKPITPLAKPVGTGASTVYSGGGKKSNGNSSSSWINGSQYGIPVWGSCLQFSDALNNGDYLNAASFFGLGFFEAFTLGEGTEVRLGMNAAKEGAQYSVAYEMKLATTSYPNVYRGAHFLEANKALSSAIESDLDFASSMSELGVSIPRSSTGSILARSPLNWVWHHDLENGVMQLVPKSQHTIGSQFWNTLHPDGFGGFSIWGK
jgi:hypothetical protein